MGTGGTYVTNILAARPTVGMQDAKVQFQPAVRKPGSSIKPPES